jgi:hypothetical protein
MGELNACRVLVGRPEGKRKPGIPRHRWEDNTKLNIREVGFGDMNRIHPVQDGEQWSVLVSSVISLGSSIK